MAFKTVTPDYFNKAKQGLSNTNVKYTMPGTVKGTNGVFEIGVRPSVSGNRFGIDFSNRLNDCMTRYQEESHIYYDAEILTELKSGYEICYYPSLSNLGGGDGLIVRITPRGGDSWLGVFEFGTIAENGISNIYRMPNSDKLCVVANGAGYLVSSIDRSYCLIVKSIPIKDVRIIEKQGIIIFADYTDIVAYNNLGMKWRTQQIALDGFKINSVSDTTIGGEYYEPRKDDIEFFIVELLSGNLEKTSQQ